MLCSNLHFFISSRRPAGRRATLCPMQPQALTRGVRPAGWSPRGSRLAVQLRPDMIAAELGAMVPA